MPPKVTQFTEPEIRQIAQQEAKKLNAQDDARIQQAVSLAGTAHESVSRVEAVVSRVESELTVTRQELVAQKQANTQVQELVRQLTARVEKVEQRPTPSPAPSPPPAPSPDPAVCDYAFDKPFEDVAASGGSGNSILTCNCLPVTFPTPFISVDWIHAGKPHKPIEGLGENQEVVHWHVSPNTLPAKRTGTVTIGDAVLTFNQAANIFPVVDPVPAPGPIPQPTPIPAPITPAPVHEHVPEPPHHHPPTPTPAHGEVPSPTLTTHVEVHGEQIPWVGSKATVRIPAGYYGAYSIKDPDARVHLEPGALVVFAGESVLLDLGVDSAATAVFSGNANVRLRTVHTLDGSNFILEPGASLIPRKAALDPDDTQEYGGGLIIGGKCDIKGTNKGRRYVRLSRGCNKGESVLFLQEPLPQAWREGERIILPGTVQDGNVDRTDPWNPTEVDDNEEIVIDSISADRKQVTLRQQLRYDHPGSPVDEITGKQYFPHIGNLDSDTKIVPEVGAEYHTIFLATASGVVDSLRLVGSGRTRMNPAAFSKGEIGHLGVNGRHGFHLHHTQDVELRGLVLERMGHWALTVHGARAKGGDILIYGSHTEILGGPGIVGEDGTETGEFDGVMVVAMKGLGGRESGVAEGDVFAHSSAGAWTAGRSMTLRNLVIYRCGAGVKSYDNVLFEQVPSLFPSLEVIGCNYGITPFSRANHHPSGSPKTEPRTILDFEGAVLWHCAHTGLDEKDYNSYCDVIRNLTVLMDPKVSARAALPYPPHIFPQANGVWSRYVPIIDNVNVQGSHSGLATSTGRDTLTRSVRNSRFSVPPGNLAINLITETHYSADENAFDFYNVHISEGSKIRYTLEGMTGNPERRMEMFGPRLFMNRQVTIRSLNGDPANSWWIFATEQQGQRPINSRLFMRHDWNGTIGPYNAQATYTDMMNLETGDLPEGLPISYYTEKYNIAFNGLTLPPDGFWRGRPVEQPSWLVEEDAVAVRMTPEEAVTDPLPAWKASRGPQKSYHPFPFIHLHDKDARRGAFTLTVLSNDHRQLHQAQIYVSDTPKGKRRLVLDTVTPHPIGTPLFLPEFDTEGNRIGDGKERYYFIRSVDYGMFQMPWLVDPHKQPNQLTWYEGWHTFSWTYDPSVDRTIPLVGDVLRDIRTESTDVWSPSVDKSTLGRPFTSPRPGTVPLMVFRRTKEPEAPLAYQITVPSPDWGYEFLGIGGWVYNTPAPGRQIVYDHHRTHHYLPGPATWAVWGNDYNHPSANPWFFLPAKGEV
jgi:hypothetical protein